MELVELIKVVKEIVCRIPENIKDNLFASSDLTDRTVVKELTAKNIIWGRDFYLVQQKLYAFVRAVVQAAILYYLMIGIFFSVYSIANSQLRFGLAATSFATNIVFLHYFLWWFHKQAFNDILFEQSFEVRKKEYRFLGLSVRIICEIQAVLSFLHLVSFYEKTQKYEMRISYLEFGVFLFIAVCYFFYVVCYFLERKRSFSLQIQEVPSGRINIYELSKCYEINLNTQTVIELHNGDLYIARYMPKRNPDYGHTPEPYQIPAKSVLYVQFGEKQIKYDWNKKKWIEIKINPVPLQ